MSQAIKTSTIYGIILGTIFWAVFFLFRTELASIFLHDELLIHQAGYFINILGPSAPMLGVINMITIYFQALGAPVKSLLITIMRNVVLFIPAVIILNNLWQLSGIIAAQPIAETILAIICIAMYAKDSNDKKMLRKQTLDFLSVILLIPSAVYDNISNENNRVIGCVDPIPERMGVMPMKNQRVWSLSRKETRNHE